MTPQTRALLVRLCAERAGLWLASAADMDVEARLGPLARHEGYTGVDDLMAAVNSQNLNRLGWRVVEAMSPAPARQPGWRASR